MRAPEATPYAPPFATADLPGTGGAIGPEPEDFRVDEIPAYLPSGAGEHRYVRIEKRLVTTPDAVRSIAVAAGVDAREIGYAGLKDKHAVTTQWLSLPKKSLEPERWALPANVRVLEASFHNNKLRTGHLSGNRFAIAITGADERALELGRAILARLASGGLPNYFGAQRFGREGDNLARARAWLAGGAKQRLSSFLLKLYPSVVQAEVFNRYLTLRKSEGLQRLLEGEVVRLEGSGAMFVVESAKREAPRLLAREVHLTGPIIGPKARPARGRPLELELEAQRTAGADERVLEALGRFAPGARRDLVIYPRDLDLAEEGAGRLRIAFELPSGSYATVLLRELTRSAFFGGDERRGE